MNEEKPLQVAIYCRVSKDTLCSDGRLQDPENQLGPLKKFCSDMEWNIKFIFIDKKSGADSNRPEFKKMLAEVRQHHFDLLLVWSLDRFSREPLLNTFSYLEQLKKHNVNLKSYTEGIDTRELSDTGELMMMIFFWISKNERDKLSRRTKAGIQRRKNLGVWKGGRKKDRINKEEGNKILELNEKGLSSLKIMRKLNISRKSIEEYIQLKGGGELE